MNQDAKPIRRIDWRRRLPLRFTLPGGLLFFLALLVAAPFLLWIGIDRESTAAEPTPVGAAKKAKA